MLHQAQRLWANSVEHSSKASPAMLPYHVCVEGIESFWSVQGSYGHPIGDLVQDLVDGRGGKGG